MERRYWRECRACADQSMAEIVEKMIREWKPGDTVQGYFYIRQSEMKQTTNNNKYMNFTFSDKSGDVNAKLWDWDEDNVTRFAAGILVKARGQVVDWQGQLQLKIDRIRRTIDTDQVNISDYVPSAPLSGETMLAELYDVLGRFRNSDLRSLTETILKKYESRILICPAAKKNHHAVRCGWLYHVSTMLRSAQGLVQVYDFLDEDLLYAGVMLHDIGKCEEMEMTEIGLVSDYTTGGNLLGHIIQGIQILHETGKALGTNPECLMLLEHMILSHHYEPEYGSPKYPMFPEAEMLHYLDVMDARMYDMSKILDGTEPGKFSERVWSLENRSLYRHTEE